MGRTRRRSPSKGARSTGWTRLLSTILAAVLLTASCGSIDTPTPTSADKSAPVPWKPLPADGKCLEGLVLKPGESCLHEYSYQAGLSIGASGTAPIIEDASNEFSVDADGNPSYRTSSSGGMTEIVQQALGNRENPVPGIAQGCAGDSRYSRSSTSVSYICQGKDGRIVFIAHAQSDGTFYIEEATQTTMAVGR